MDNIGIIYGTASSTRFDVAVSDPGLRRLDYVSVLHEENRVLCQVEEIVRKGGMSYEEAAQGATDSEDKLAASVHVVGYVDGMGRVQTPMTPFRAGQEIQWADEALVSSVLGLGRREGGAYMGRVQGTTVPVHLNMNMLAQKHVSVLAKTGAGKSYTVGVLLEEFLAAGVPLVILDPHGEYGSLRHANIDPSEIDGLADHDIRPRSFDKEVAEYALDVHLNPEAQKLRLEGVNLEGHEIADLLGGKVSGGQLGLLYQAVKEVKEHMPSYTLQDIMDAVQQNKAASKWNVLNALDALMATDVFHIRGTPVKELVKPSQCTIINLKGVAPDIQEVAVTRLTGMLWEARKRGDVPPFILVCEEAHNFCPERGVGNAISGAVIRTVASEGRKFGMGLVIVSQRPAKIDKNVLSQCNTQFVLKVTNPNDLKAIVSSVEGITSKTSDEVQRLPIGTALVAGGGLTQPVFVDVRPRLTRHGGASIDVVSGKAAKAPVRRPKVPTLPDLPEPEHDALDTKERESSHQEEKPVKVVFDVPPPAPERRRRRAPAVTTPPVAPIRRLQDREDASGSDGGPDPGAAAPATRPPASAAATKAQPDVAAAAGPQDPPAERAKPASAPTWTAKDAPTIQRVAQRVGIVGPNRSPEATVEFIQRLAKQNGRNPDMRVALYAEIGRTVCSDELPACIRCPLADACQHHQRVRTERKKNRSPIRRLWNR